MSTKVPLKDIQIENATARVYEDCLETLADETSAPVYFEVHGVDVELSTFYGSNTVNIENSKRNGF